MTHMNGAGGDEEPLSLDLLFEEPLEQPLHQPFEEPLGEPFEQALGEPFDQALGEPFDLPLEQIVEPPARVPPVPRRDRRRRSRRWWPYVLLAVAAAVVASVVVPFGRHQWAESLVRQPDHYTTVAFADPGGLPTTVASGKPVTFTFTVGNQEARNQVYRYFLTSSPSTVTAFSGSFGGGSLAVAKGRSRSRHVSADPKCAGSPCRIAVVLVGPRVVVDFNVRVTGLSAPPGQSR